MNLQHLRPLETHKDFDDPKAYAEHLMTQSRSSFTLGMKMLSKERREAIYAVYAFCRVVDDIADEAGDKNEKADLLQDWRREIDALYEGTPRSLIGKALARPISDFKIPKQELILMIEGMEADVHGPVCAPSLNELLGYTRRVAGTVGMMSIRIFGVSNVEARDRFALHLSDAFQLTNILRDVEEDAELGRLYLPREILLQHGIENDDPHVVAQHPNLRAVCRDIGKIARARFDEARRALSSLEGEPVRTALIMMGVYEGYLERMEAADFERDAALHKMSKWQKLARGLRYGFAFPKRAIPAPDDNTPPLANVDAS
ncbi:MAG: squalene/phytoene synthase family protein [Hyphomicrobiales bacterium]